MKRTKSFRANGGMFVLLLLLSSVTNAEPAAPLTPEIVAKKMAQRLFQDSGYSVVVRKSENLTECKQVSVGAGVFVAPQNDVVTEFMYGSHAICVTVYVRTDPAGGNTAQFDPGAFEVKLGSLPSGNFGVHQRFAFMFPEDPNTSPDESTLELFFRKVPRPLNLQHPGSVAAAMKAIESPDAGSQFANDLAGTTPASANRAVSVDPKIADGKGSASLMVPAAILLSSISLIGAGLFFFFRSRQRKAPLAATSPVVEEREARPRTATRQDSSGKRPGRRVLSFPIKTVEDQKLVNEIDALVLDLTTKGAIRWSEVDDILKKANAINQLAVRENLPALEIVKEFLTDQLKQAHAKTRAVPGRPVAR